MTVTIPAVTLAGALLYLAYRYMGLRFWHALLALVFGFLLAATFAAPEIRNILDGITQWINRP